MSTNDDYRNLADFMEWVDPEGYAEVTDNCQHEWELRSEHDTWVCCWCQAETTSPDTHILPDGSAS